MLGLVELYNYYDIMVIITRPIVKLSWIPGLDHSPANTVFAQSRIYLSSKSCARDKASQLSFTFKKFTFMKKKKGKVKKSNFLVFLYRAFTMGVINSSRSSIGLF